MRFYRLLLLLYPASFYTTKPDGSGIGLALSRQIAEAHGGALTLSNRIDDRGCEARLSLPFTRPGR